MVVKEQQRVFGPVLTRMCSPLWAAQVYVDSHAVWLGKFRGGKQNRGIVPAKMGYQRRVPEEEQGAAFVGGPTARVGSNHRKRVWVSALDKTPEQCLSFAYLGTVTSSAARYLASTANRSACIIGV